MGDQHSGVIVGEARSPVPPAGNGHIHAFRWEDGVMTDLHYTPGIAGLASAAFDINESGVIVGHAQFNVAFPEEAAVWSNGTVAVLPNLGFRQGNGLAINSAGDVVGDTFTAQGQERAVLWRNGEIHDLTNLIEQDPDGGWDWLFYAWEINDLGQIVGVGRRNGMFDQGFLLTPIACPADFNQDGAVNSQDFFDFLAAFFAGDVVADFNGDKLVNSQDFFDFLAAFFAGCP